MLSAEGRRVTLQVSDDTITYFVLGMHRSVPHTVACCWLAAAAAACLFPFASLRGDVAFSVVVLSHESVT